MLYIERAASFFFFLSFSENLHLYNYDPTNEKGTIFSRALRISPDVCGVSESADSW